MRVGKIRETLIPLVFLLCFLILNLDLAFIYGDNYESGIKLAKCTSELESNSIDTEENLELLKGMLKMDKKSGDESASTGNVSCSNNLTAGNGNLIKEQIRSTLTESEENDESGVEDDENSPEGNRGLPTTRNKDNKFEFLSQSLGPSFGRDKVDLDSEVDSVVADKIIKNKMNSIKSFKDFDETSKDKTSCNDQLPKSKQKVGGDSSLVNNMRLNNSINVNKNLNDKLPTFYYPGGNQISQRDVYGLQPIMQNAISTNKNMMSYPRPVMKINNIQQAKSMAGNVSTSANNGLIQQIINPSQTAVQTISQQAASKPQQRPIILQTASAAAPRIQTNARRITLQAVPKPPPPKQIILQAVPKPQPPKQIILQAATPKPQKQIMLQAAPKPQKQKQIVLQAVPKPQPPKQIILQAAAPKPQKQIMLQAAPKPQPQKQIVLQAVPKPQPPKQIILQAAAPKPQKQIILQAATPKPQKQIMLQAAPKPQKQKQIVLQAVSKPQPPKQIILQAAAPKPQKQIMLQAAPKPQPQKQIVLQAVSKPQPPKQIILQAAAPKPQKQIMLQAAPKPQPQRQIVLQAVPKPQPPKQIILQAAAPKPQKQIMLQAVPKPQQQKQIVLQAASPKLRVQPQATPKQIILQAAAEAPKPKPRHIMLQAVPKPQVVTPGLQNKNILKKVGTNFRGSPLLGNGRVHTLRYVDPNRHPRLIPIKLVGNRKPEVRRFIQINDKDDNTSNMEVRYPYNISNVKTLRRNEPFQLINDPTLRYRPNVRRRRVSGSRLIPVYVNKVSPPIGQDRLLESDIAVLRRKSNKEPPKTYKVGEIVKKTDDDDKDNEDDDDEYIKLVRVNKNKGQNDKQENVKYMHKNVILEPKYIYPLQSQNWRVNPSMQGNYYPRGNNMMDMRPKYGIPMFPMAQNSGGLQNGGQQVNPQERVDNGVGTGEFPDNSIKDFKDTRPWYLQSAFIFSFIGIIFLLIVGIIAIYYIAA